jgi:protein-tyrosine phosphatase
VTTDRWIDLDGAVNVRDLGGLPTADGRRTARGRLIRADNLQDLSDRDVAVLVDEWDVRAVADLRTGVEVDSEGPAPLHGDDRVEVHHLSLFPETGRATDAASEDEDGDDDGPVVLPWQERVEVDDRRSERSGVAGVYLGYLEDRGDSIVEALRLIASAPGATIVHCAAGKDRTGTVVALALAEVGVTRDAIVADYVASADRIEEIFARLEASPTYSEDVRRRPPDEHAPKPETMTRLLELIDARYGGVSAWLRRHGWTDADHAALCAALLEP